MTGLASLRLHAGVAAIMAACLVSGCSELSLSGAGGAFRAQSLRSDAVLLTADYDIAVYGHDQLTGTSIMLSDTPIDRILSGDVKNAQLMHIELLWLPKAGKTPMDSSATNASIRHIVISNGEVGIYGGAGFALPSADPSSSDKVTLTMRDASVELQESTAGFVDLLSPARLTGTIVLEKDNRRTRQLSFGASQIVTNALGRTRYVLTNPAATSAPRKRSIALAIDQ